MSAGDRSVPTRGDDASEVVLPDEPRGQGAEASLQTYPDALSKVALALLEARSATAAVRALCPQLAATVGVPVVGWVSQGGGPMDLVAADNVPAAVRQRLRDELAIIPPLYAVPPVAYNAFIAHACRLVDIEEATVLDAGAAVVLLPADALPVTEQQILTRWLRSALRRIDAVVTAELRNADLEMGLAMMAHELTGPLITLSAGHSQLLLDQTLSQTTRLRVEELGKQAEQLTHLIRGLLDWAVRGRELPRAAVEIGGVVQQAIGQLGREASARIRLVSDGPAWLLGDGATLQLALTNVLTNALKYSPRDSIVTVTVGWRGDRISIVVEDEGPGVPSYDLETLFDPFVRSSHVGTPRAGAGLGLFVTRRIVEAHGGEVWFEPRDKGAGLHITLPHHRETDP